MRRLGLCLALAILFLSACSPSLESAIVGNWVNASGYTIEFKANGDGEIPGVTGQIPATSFKYVIVDQAHVSINLVDQKYTIEVHVDGDKLTWKDQLGEEIYTRVKK
jgi:hypothetical protein